MCRAWDKIPDMLESMTKMSMRNKLYTFQINYKSFILSITVVGSINLGFYKQIIAMLFLACVLLSLYTLPLATTAVSCRAVR